MEIQLLATMVDLAEASIWPNGDIESSSELRVLITVSESLSRIKEVKSNS